MPFRHGTAGVWDLSLIHIWNSLSAAKTGAVMCTNYIVSSLTFLAVLMDMTIKQNGHMGLSGWLDLFIPVLSAVCILSLIHI